MHVRFFPSGPEDGVCGQRTGPLPRLLVKEEPEPTFVRESTVPIGLPQ